jgi:pectate lyase
MTLRTRSAAAAVATAMALAVLSGGGDAVAAVPSFPGAEGFGTTTPGGRGGKVIQVTNLNNSGAGSLRAAVEATGPRIVVFRVGGTITLRSSLDISNPYITIAGQTAPGGGIQLKMDPAQHDGLLDIETTDVVIRGMKLRQGPHKVVEAAIPLEVSEASNIVLDHNSIYWATDEVVTTYDDTSNITVSWNIIAEGLSNSTHYEGEHSRGLFISGDNSRSITAHHNLMAHNMRRNPEVSTNGVADIRNNVVYDWGTYATLLTDKRNSTGMNVVGNYYKPGPSTDRSREEIDGKAYSAGMPLHVSGNVRSDGTAARLDSDAKRWGVSAQVSAPPVKTTSAAQAYTDVLAKAGARYPTLDSADTRLLDEVRTGKGRIIDSPTQVGGWPTLASGTPITDPDMDGMPSSWETARGLSPSKNDSAADRNGDGYTNIEEYINSLIS